MYFAFFELWNQTDDPLLKWPFLIFRSPPFNLTQDSTMAAFAVCLLAGNCFVVESKKKPVFLVLGHKVLFITKKISTPNS